MKSNRNVSFRAKRLNKALCALYPRISTALAYKTPWQLLTATILSAQTLDKTVNRITPGLFRAYPNAAVTAKSSPAVIGRHISGVNYYRTKAQHIVAAARAVEMNHQGSVPLTMGALVALPGVGRKTANVVINELSKKPSGIVVDTHVARLSRLFGLTKKTKPVDIEQDLMRLIPDSQWRGFSLRLIQYGRDFCPAREHGHASCPLRRFIAH